MNRNQPDYLNPLFKPETLVDLLRWRAATEPDKTAYTYLRDGNKKELSLTYSELDKKARSVALMLQRKGLTGERALLLYPPGLDYIAGFFGCLYAGVTAVPAYPPDPNRLNRSLPRLQAIVNDAGATVALTTDAIMYMIRMLKLGSKLTNSLEKIPFMRKFRNSMKYFSSEKQAVANSTELGDLQWISTDSTPSIGHENWAAPSITAQTTSFLQYTSGSTGNPKGVILSHSNLLANSEIIKTSLGYKPNTVGVFWLPIYHDMGLIGGVLQPLYSGCPSVFMSPIAFLQRPLRWLETISRQPEDRVVSTAAPNFAYDMCVKKATPEFIKSIDLSRWEMALSGAEPVRAQTIERFSETFKPAGFKKTAFLPAYGLAEATLFVSGAFMDKEPITTTVDKTALQKNTVLEVPKDDPAALTLVSSGHGHSTQTTLIVNPDTFLSCKPGEIGEIWVKGPSVSLGYYGREEATKETFQNYLADTGDGPFLRTGDLGFMKDDEIFVAGRVKDLIIIRGTNHYPQDIELSVEQAHPEIRPGCSAAITVDMNNTEELVIVCEVRHNKNQNFSEIIQAVREAVTENHDLQTRTVVLIKARTIHKTSSGKIMRQATKADFLADKLSVIQRWDSGTTLESKPPAEEEKVPLQTEETETLHAKSDTRKRIETWIAVQLSESLGIPAKEIDVRQPFISFGLDSAQAVGLSGDLEDFLDRSLSPTLIWDYPTIESLARYLSEEDIEFPSAASTKTKPSLEYEPIAVIGMGSRFPGANNTEEFWQLLKNGVDGISEVPADRWDADAYYDSDPAVPGKMITKEGGFLEHADLFDAHFFGISPREAAHIDPQQRLLLEVSWEALENAGKVADTLAGSRTGVFVGISSNDYSRLQRGSVESLNPWAGTGNAFSIAANRLSYFYDFRGPSLSMDTACSSSLVSVHTACQSLRNRDCDMALAGGVNLILSPEITITFSQARMMAANGRCKTFDESADGYGRGEGAGIVVLKRLSDALKDKDNILAVVSGSAVNQDGRSNGITAPNRLAQQAVINEALDNADLAPDQIHYIETHGTGTPLGDPIEIESLKNVMLQERAKSNPLLIGSVKTNIAHLESAAGIAGFIKVVLALQHEEIPPHLHFKKLNPYIKLDDSQIRIVTEKTPWPRSSKKRYAGISAFGFGGTNAHLVLEEAPEVTIELTDEVRQKRPLLIPLSAQNDDALRELAANYLRLLQKSEDKAQGYLYTLAYNAALRRNHFDQRLALVAEDPSELVSQLELFLNHKEGRFATDQRNPALRPKIAFVYSGQGPQWWAMGRELFQQEPVFKETIDRIATLLEPYSGWSLIDELHKNEEESRLDQTEIAQPALFAIQVGLTAVWKTLGVVPDSVTGHSIGEIAAAHISGILSIEDAVKIVYHRSKLMQEATGLGKMAAVDLPYDELKKILSGYESEVSLGAHNSHTSNVISGDEKAIDAILAQLKSKDVFYKKLPVNYAFHSPQMEPFSARLSEAIEGIKLHKTTLPVISTVTGKNAQDQDYGPEYWGRNIRECVQFSDAVDLLLEQDHTIFIEIGPHPVLKHYIRQNLEKQDRQALVLSSLRRKEAERAQMLLSLGQMYTIGYSVDWHKLNPVKAGHFSLPFYPFQRERYWIDDPQKKDFNETNRHEHPLLGKEHRSALMPNSPNWTVQLKYDYVAYLNNGREAHSPSLPESAYLEMAMAASAQTFNTGHMILQNIVFKNSLTVRESETRQLHFSLSPVSAKKAYFQAYSKPLHTRDESGWMMHSLGSIVAEDILPDIEQIHLDIEALKKEMRNAGTVKDFFSELKGSQHILENLSKSGSEIWVGKDEILMHFNIKDLEILQPETYRVHPMIIDNLIQLIALAAQIKDKRPLFYRPHSVGTFKLISSPKSEFWAHIAIRRNQNGKPVLLSQIRLVHNDGSPIFEMKDLRLQTLSLGDVISNLFYEIEWEKHHAASGRRKTAELPAKWLIFSDESEWSHSLMQKLVLKGKSSIVANYGKENKKLREGLYHFNPADKEAFQKILAPIVNNNTGLLYLWNLDPTTNIDSFMSTTLESLHNLETKPAEIWLYMESAVAVKNQPQTLDPHQAFLWDIQRTLSLQFPELNIRVVNLNSQNANLFDLLHLSAPEDTIAVNGKEIFAPRLIRSQQMEQLKRLTGQFPALSESRTQPNADEIEIEVKACTINMNTIKSQASSAEEAAHPFGIECAGVVKSIGKNVSTFKKGDPVVALALKGVRKFTLTHSKLVQPKPENLSFEEAGSLPLAYLSTHYALTFLARIQQREDVLIHDAHTAFGKAAINIARHFNSRVFATVETAEQKTELEVAGIKYVFLNTSLDYIDNISDLTSQLGVDIIVNTTSNEQMSGSFSILKDFGRFLELNTDGSFDQPLVYHHLRRNVSFFAVDMKHIAAGQPDLVHTIFTEVMDLVNKSVYEIPAYKTVAYSALAEEPVYLQQLRAEEKVVLSFSKKGAEARADLQLLNSHKKYFVAGSFDENEKALIDWMAENGASDFYLYAIGVKDRSLQKFKKSSVKIHRVETLANLPFAEINGVIISMSAFSAKLELSHLKNELIEIARIFSDRPLDFFVSLSSFDLGRMDLKRPEIHRLDHLILSFHHQRLQKNLHSLHVQLGGNIPEKREKALQRWNILSHLLNSVTGRIIINETDWPTLFKKFEGKPIPALYKRLLTHKKSNLSGKAGQKEPDISRADLLAADKNKREELLNRFLCAEIARVVKISENKLKLDQPLTSMGIDSLMAIELKNTVESKLDVNLPIATLLQGPSILDLSAEFIPQLDQEPLAHKKAQATAKKTDEIRDFRLSGGQKAMFFQHLMNPESIFNLAYAVRIRSKFDKEILRQSFQALVDRHPSLRTTFHLVDGQPVQRIHPDMPAFFYEEALSGQSDAQIKARINEEVLNHFDLENGPLMRVFLLERSERETILLFVMHHIVTDIWSQALLLDEMSQIFEAAGDASALPIQAEDYTDYIVWQDELLEGESGSKLLKYWENKLSGGLPQLNIPTDKPRPAVQTYRGSTETIWFPEELSQAVHRFAEEHNTTVFTLLLTIYYVMLNRYTGQNDIVVGSPTAGRSKKEFAGIIGYFVNPVPFRAHLNNNPTFREFFEQVKATVLEAFDNMDYPLTQMVEKLQPKRDPSRTPLFQTMFILQRAHLMHDQGLSQFALSREGATLNLGGLTIESMELEQGVAPFDLTMMAVESGSGLAASLGYNIDLFEAETIRRMLHHYLMLIEDVLRDPSRPVSRLRMLPEEEFTLLTKTWNATADAIPEDICIHQLIERRAAEHPDKSAVAFEGDSLSYAQLNSRANQLARHLVQKGIGPENLAGICVERSMDMIVAILAVLKTGAAYVPIDPSYPQERIRYMFTDANLKLILTHTHLLNKVEQTEAEIVLLDGANAEIESASAENLNIPVDPANLAYIIYTSGSTGKPKGTMLNHRGLVNALHSTRKNYFVSADSKVLQFASFSFDASVEEIFSTLTAGATLQLVRKETLLSLAELIDLINKQNITNMTLPPSVLTVLQPADFPTVETVVSAGEKCPPETAAKWAENRHFINGYGPTETTICAATYLTETPFKRYTVPIGKPIRNVQAYILDANFNPVPVGVPGELYIGGAGVARGYFKRPALTAERFVPDPFGDTPGARLYRTGDLVRYIPDGNMEFIDRIDYQVKIRGFRIELGEIETVVKSCANISDAVVIARRMGGETRIAAYVIPEDSGAYDENALKLCIKNKLPDYMIPAAIVTMKAFPLTSNGKLNRKALPDPESGQQGQTFVKPGSEIERKLAVIWQEVLQLDQVGINDSFFDLGGHSLGIVQVQGKIKEVFDRDVNVVEMFKYPTIGTLAKFLGDESSSREAIKKSMDRASRQREATKTQQQRVRPRRRNR